MELHTETVGALPVVPDARRGEILAGLRDTATHGRVQAGLPALRALEVSASPGGGGVRGSARIVAWNVERGREVEALAELARDQGADALLATELDLGMARSGQRATVRELARSLGWGYAFAVEFLELGLGSERERAAFAGQRNEVGYHGAAILSRHALGRPALVRLDAGGDWFDGARGEARVGGRIAVLATLAVGGCPVTLAAVHLESHGSPALRDRQTAALLEALAAYAPDAPALIGGDVNTHSLGPDELRDRDALARALRADPDRLRAPIPHEPLFARLADAGFEREACNATDTSTQRTAEGRGSLRLDWFFARGLLCASPAVVPAVAATGETLSDHDAIAVDVTPGPRPGA